MQVTTDCQYTNFPPEYQFHWRGAWGQIESVAVPNYCWSMAYVNENDSFQNTYFVSLVLKACNQQATLQVND